MDKQNKLRDTDNYQRGWGQWENGEGKGGQINGDRMRLDFGW